MTRGLIAILRGIQPREAVGAAATLAEEGFPRIEVPLNSPQPFASIERMVRELRDESIVGAGTVANATEVRDVANAGGQMVVSPNTDLKVIAQTKRLGMESWPGMLTVSECMAALDAGADGLKLFPASTAGPEGVRALRATLPKPTVLYAVGGAGPESFCEWIAAGISGFGIGTALYQPGTNIRELRKRAQQIVAAYDRAADSQNSAQAAAC